MSDIEAFQALDMIQLGTHIRANDTWRIDICNTRIIIRFSA